MTRLSKIIPPGNQPFMTALLVFLGLMMAPPVRSEPVLPIQGVLDAPTFIALRAPILLPDDADAAQLFLDRLAKRGFDVNRQDFMDEDLSVLYSDAITLPSVSWSAPDERARIRFEAAKNLILVGPPSAPRLTKRYLDYRAAQNGSYVDWSEFRERIASELGYRTPKVYPLQIDEFMRTLIGRAFDLEYIKEGGLYTVAREYYEAFESYGGFWPEITARSTSLLDPNISPDHLFIPRLGDLLRSNSGWITVHFEIPVGSTFIERSQNNALADAEMDVAVIHILRPWLDERILTRLRGLYPPQINETNIGRISLALFPSRVHISFLVGRRLHPLFVQNNGVQHAAVNVSPTADRSTALLRSVAFSGVSSDATFLFGVLVDGGGS